MLLTDFIKEGIRDLEDLYPTIEAHNMIMMLCESFLGTKNYTHIVEPEYEIDPAKVDALEEALARLRSGEPVQHILGFSEFCGQRYKVTPDVLIPRPETELLVRNTVKEASRIQRSRIPYGKKASPVRILDLCTGSGCIAWTLAVEVPGVEVVAVDISEAALDIARSQSLYFGHNLREKGMVDPVFVEADILDTEQDFNYGMFDIIVSNPPYIMESEKSSMRKNVLDFEPALALFVPDADPLLFYRAIARWSQRFLTKDGKAMTEINETLGKETEEVFKSYGFSHTEIVKDFFDRNRFVIYSKNTI
ncbi:MAG: peptide chain release factor N(5)-glutamine methyltransferase [Bacteroidia bacterium]|nr:peptide chain release factor N(5)-glutamine methyltransferase [Bacteroidia bacterium]